MEMIDFSPCKAVSSRENHTPYQRMPLALTVCIFWQWRLKALFGEPAGFLSSTSSFSVILLMYTKPDFLNRQRFQQGRVGERGSTDLRRGQRRASKLRQRSLTGMAGRSGIPKGGNTDCAMIAAAPVLPARYVVSASPIAD